MASYSRVNVIVSRRDVSGRTTIVNYSSKAQRVKLRQVSGNKREVSFPIGPLQVNYDGMGIEYVEVDRPGRTPLLESTSRKARTIQFNAVLANPQTSGQSSVEGIINRLTRMAAEDEDLVFIYGVRTLPYRVRMTDFSYGSVRRSKTGLIWQAVADIQLTERVALQVDPVSLNAIQYTPASSGSTYKPKTGGGGSTTPAPSTPKPPPVVDLGDPTPADLPSGVASPTRPIR